MKIFKTITISLALLAAHSGASAADLSGCWTDEVGANYYVRQVKNEVWWLGESSPSNAVFVNVVNGKLDGNTLILSWADVPKGQTYNSGILVLTVSGNGQTMKAIKKTGGYGPSNWQKSANCP